MPFDESGCIGTVLRMFGTIVLETIAWSHVDAVLGYLGAWTVRIVTFGYCKPDPESWGMIFLGFWVLVALCVLVGLSK